MSLQILCCGVEIHHIPSHKGTKYTHKNIHTEHHASCFVNGLVCIPQEKHVLNRNTTKHNGGKDMDGLQAMRQGCQFIPDHIVHDVDVKGTENLYKTSTCTDIVQYLIHVGVGVYLIEYVLFMYLLF